MVNIVYMDKFNLKVCYIIDLKSVVWDLCGMSYSKIV